MRICFLVRDLVHGGAQRQLTLLAIGLGKRGHDVSVAAFYSGGQIERELMETGISVVNFGKKGRWDVVGFSWRLIAHLRRTRPDILHSYLGVSNILSVALRPFLAEARIVWGVRASDVDLTYYDWLARRLYAAECLLSRFADLIIVNSQRGFDHSLRNGFPGDRMVVVPNGIDVDRFKPDRRMGLKVRSAWGIAADEVLIGLIGRIDPMKDHGTFLRAAAEIKRTSAGVRFVCVGDGPGDYKQSMRALATDLRLDDVLIWADARNDIAAVYNAIDIVCSSSSFGEGFSNVVGEAMACGIPCVVTDVGDSARIVGDLGRVVPPGNPGALASALLATIAELASGSDAGAQRRRERVISEFSTAKLLDRTEAILRTLAERRP